MATIKIKSFKFHKDSLTEMRAQDPALAKIAAAAMTARENEINTVHTINLLCWGGPMHGQCLELEDNCTDSRSLAFEMRGMVGSYKRAVDTSKRNYGGRPELDNYLSWCGSGMQARKPEPHEMAPVTRDSTTKATGSSKGFELFGELLGQIDSDEAPIELVQATETKSHEAICTGVDDFGTEFHIVTRAQELQSLGRVDVWTEAAGRGRKQVIKHRADFHQAGGWMMDDFGDAIRCTLTTLTPAVAFGWQVDASFELVTFQVARTRFRVRNTPEKRNAFREKLMKNRRSFADKLMNPANPAAPVVPAAPVEAVVVPVVAAVPVVAEVVAEAPEVAPVAQKVALVPSAADEVPQVPKLKHGKNWAGQDLTGWIYGEKLDGCRAFWDGARFWGKDGQPLHLPEVAATMPAGVVLDGEIWAGRGNFEAARLYVQYGTPSELVRFVAFDAPTAQGTWAQRLQTVQGVECVTVHAITSMTEMAQEVADLLDAGAEGVMCHAPQVNAYRGGRDATLIKIKAHTFCHFEAFFDHAVEAPTAAPVVAEVVADAAPASQELAPVPSAADEVSQDLAPVVAGFVADIPAGLAVQAYTGTSFSPERRGASIRKEYADDLAQVLDVLQEHARKGGTLDKLADVFQAYRTRQGRALRAYLASSSHCFSAMIAGPARFPVARMQKREGIAHKRLNEYLDGGKVALQRAIRELRPDLRPIMASDADAIDRLTAKLAQAERDHAMMKAGNVAIRKHAKAGQAHQVAALLELGFTERAAIEATKPDHMGRAGFARFELTNSNANIKRIKERIEQIERNQAAQVVQTEGADGVTLEDDAPANRVRLYFPGKPSDDVRADLKAHGFRWAPSVGAWQAYRNWRALTAAQRLAGVNLAEVAPASQEPAPVPNAADEVSQDLAPTEAPTNSPTEAPTAAPVVAEVVAETAPASQELATVPAVADEVPQDLAPVVPTVPTLHQKARAKSGAWEAQLWQAGGLCWLAFWVLGAAVPVLSSYATRRDVLAALQRLAGVVLSPAELGFAPGLAGLERVARLYADAGCGADAFVSGVLYAYKDCHEYGKAPTTLGRWTKLRADMEAQGMPAGIGLPGFFDAVQCGQYPAPVAPTEAPTEAPTVAPLAALELVEHTTARGKVLRGVVRADLTKEQAQALDAYTFRKDGGWFIRERHLTDAVPVVAQPVQVPTVADKVAQVLAQAHAAATDGTDSQGDERAALLAQFAHLEQGQGTATASRNIKRELKRTWPGVVFGVRKDSASAVRVTWADGPSETQVKALVGRFCEGSFDGMTDCYEYRADVFNDLFGGCCYLFTRRDVGDELAQRAIERAFEGWPALPTVEDWRASRGLFDWRNDGQVWARRVRDALEELDGVAELA